MNKNLRKNLHLTLDDRIDIQEGLNKGLTFKAIADSIGKDPSTISKEVRKHHEVRESTCIRLNQRNERIVEVCPKLSKPPYVCNNCSRKHSCKFDRHVYVASKANSEYRENLRESRSGIPLNKESFYELDRIISNGLKSGQHLYQIIVAQKLDISMATAYRYFENGYFSVTADLLPRKVKFKPRKKKSVPSIPRKARVNRTYEDFLSLIEDEQISNWVEMDTVIGRKGGKVLLTFTFTSCNFLVIRLLENKSSLAVTTVVEDLKSKLKDAGSSFGDVMPLILTDNGGEFSNVSAIEKDSDGHKETSVFFCHPRSPEEKPHIEKVHTMLRDICPKGTSFDKLIQEDVDIICSHINSVARKSLNQKCSYDVFNFTYGDEITSAFGVKRIPDTEVIQDKRLYDNLIANRK